MNCIGPYKFVGECKDNVDGIPENAHINNVAWQANNKKNRQKRICSAHRKFLGRKFKEKTSGRYSKCRYCGHSSDLKDKDIRPLTYEFSEELRKRGGEYAPVSCAVCGACRKRLTTWRDQQDVPMDDQEPTDDEIQSSQGGSSHVDNDDPMDSDFDPLQDTIQDDDNTPSNVKLVNQFLEDTGMKARINAQMHQSWNEAADTRKRMCLRVMADVGEATLDALTPHTENKLAIMRELVKKRKIEKQIDPAGQHVSSFMEDIVLTWNAGDKEVRRQVVAMGSRVLTFAEMNECNPPREKNALRRAIQEMYGQASQNSDSEEEAGRKVPGRIYFNPPLTKWFYRESNFHRLRNGHALAPAKRRGYRVHRVSPAMLRAIYSFITSNEVTKATAFGKSKKQCQSICLVFLGSI